LAAAGAQPVIEYTQITIHHYEKLITTYDDDTQTTVIKNIIIDEDTYNSLVESTVTKSFASGSNVTYKISKKAVSIYDYEYDLNESKRNINLFRSAYVSDLESQFATLMGL
jgi:predicted transcriptional regulator